MARRLWEPVLEHIRALAAARPDVRTCDAELLSRFIAQHDEDAFECLLRRHGPMVLRVARRVLFSAADAEDVFQATFLLLVRRAGAIRKRESVASWLHGVAHRLAVSTRSKRMKRQATEKRAAEERPIEAPPESAWSELEETLHEVLAQLPAKYRTPLVYCYLEGWTQEEVAQQLGKPLGTVRSWLARGRELLRKRLLRRGISLSVEGASAALLASACATAEAVPPPLRIATLQAAHLFAAGGNAMTLISPQVAALVRRGMTALLVAKLKAGAVCFLALALLIAGTGWAAHRTFSAKPPEQNETTEKSPPKHAASEERPRTDAQGDPLPPGAIARFGTIRFRHEEWLSWQFAISPDGRALATAAGRSLILWDMATGRPLRRFPFDNAIRCLAFAPDGKSVAVGGEDCIVHRIDLASGKESQRFVGHQVGSGVDIYRKGIWGIVFTADGRKLITWGSDRTVRVWEPHSGKELHQFGSKDFGSKDWFIHGLSPNGRLLAMLKIEKIEARQISLRLWDLDARKEIRQWTELNFAGSVAFSSDSKIFAFFDGSQDRPGRIVLWDIERGKELAASSSQKGSVHALAFSPDGKTLATAGFGLFTLDERIHLWDVGSMKELHVTPRLPASNGAVSQLAFSPDGKTLISHGQENHVRLWDVTSGKERSPVEGANRAIHDLAYSPNAKLVASASANRIWLWSATTGKVARMLESPNYVSAMAFSADGKLFVSESGDGTLQLWDPETGREKRRIQTKQTKGRGFQIAAFSPDGETVAVWDGEIRQTIVLWNIRTGEKLRTVEVSSEQPGVKPTLSAFYFSPDGKILYACSGTDTRVLRWDAPSGKELPFLGKHDGGVGRIALSPDGRSIAALSLSGTLYLWETATAQERLIIKDAGFASSVAFSPDGSLLALVNAGNHIHFDGEKEVVQDVENREQVRLVRVADGKVIRRFIGHLGGINCVSFSPDGHTLASGGQDTTILLWDVANWGTPAAKEMPPLTPKELATLWEDMRGKATDAHGCMSKLTSAPAQAVPFLGEKLKPVVAVDAEHFARLLKNLESDQFREREDATRELKKLGSSAEPALRKSLKENLSLEMRRRLQALLEELSGDERLRCLRAIEVLERIGDKQSRDLLRRLSQGAADAWLTEEARVTLQRLQRREKATATKEP